MNRNKVNDNYQAGKYQNRFYNEARKNELSILRCNECQCFYFFNVQPSFYKGVSQNEVTVRSCTEHASLKQLPKIFSLENKCHNYIPIRCGKFNCYSLLDSGANISIIPSQVLENNAQI